MSVDSRHERKLRAMQRIHETELMDKLQQQKALLVLNRHNWKLFVSDDQYVRKMNEWLDDTNRMIGVLQELMGLDDE